AVDAFLGKTVPRAAGREAEEAALLRKESGVVALAVGIGEAEGEHTVEPALHDSRHAAPPDRKQPDDEIGLQEALLLAHQIGGEGLVLMGVALLRLIMEPRPV